jgi:hypothetical protein
MRLYPAITHNDQHANAAPGNFSPDRNVNSAGRVDIYCADSYPQGGNSWSNVQGTYRSSMRAVAPSSPVCLAEFGGGYLLGWGGGVRGPTGYEKFSELGHSGTPC